MASDQVSPQKARDRELLTLHTENESLWLGHMDVKTMYIILYDCILSYHPFRNMVIFRNVVNGQPHSNWWDNQSNQVAFGRGNRGFIVFNNDDW